MREVALFDYNQRKYNHTFNPVVYWRQDMEDAVQPSLEDLRVERCARCLQPVPPGSSRCPGCRQPIHRLRVPPLALGAAGLLALVLALFVAFRLMRTEPVASGPVDEAPAQKIELSSEPPPANNTPSQPPQPEKRPPLNER